MFSRPWNEVEQGAAAGKAVSGGRLTFGREAPSGEEGGEQDA